MPGRDTSSRKEGRLARLDLAATMPRDDYERKLPQLQRRLAEIQRAYLTTGDAAVVVFEGWDAAGKGGTIRRIAAALDPRSFKVWPIGAPRNYYLERHFLARFMERLPPTGAISAFDRSWYGRVLVERVEGLIPKERWRAAYREINDFERMLTDDGTRVVKLFFHIDADEQLRRFRRRLMDPARRWKLSYEDFRNRSRWDDYVAAAEEMFDRTSTKSAPWNVIPANDKRRARIEALRIVTRRLAKGVDLAPPRLDPRVVQEADKIFDLSPDLVRNLSGRTD